MASLTWYGTKDDSFNTVSNWRDDVGAHPGAVPANGDSMFFTRRAIHPCRTGGDQAAKNFVELVVEPAYQFDLGTGQAPLKCSVDAVSITAARAVFLEKGTGLFDDVTIHAGFVSVRNPNNASSVWRLFGGTLRIDGSGTRVLGDVTVDGPAIAFVQGTLTLLRLVSGRVTLATGSTLTTANVDGGELRWHGDTFTALNQNGGSVFDNSIATPATHVMRNGLYSFRENRHGKAAIDLNTVDVFGGTFDTRTGYGNVGTAGGTLTIHSEDVVLRVDPRRKITLG